MKWWYLVISTCSQLKKMLQAWASLSLMITLSNETLITLANFQSIVNVHVLVISWCSLLEVYGFANLCQIRCFRIVVFHFGKILFPISTKTVAPLVTSIPHLFCLSLLKQIKIGTLDPYFKFDLLLQTHWSVRLDQVANDIYLSKLEMKLTKKWHLRTEKVLTLLGCRARSMKAGVRVCLKRLYEVRSRPSGSDLKGKGPQKSLRFGRGHHRWSEAGFLQ